MNPVALIEHVGQWVDVIGVAAIILGILIASVQFVSNIQRRKPDAYQAYRRGIGYALLLGLEILVAADIIRTVAVTPTLESIAVLGGIVLIRTFLSFSIELEVNGRLPWQEKRAPDTVENPKP